MNTLDRLIPDSEKLNSDPIFYFHLCVVIFVFKWNRHTLIFDPRSPVLAVSTWPGFELLWMAISSQAMAHFLTSPTSHFKMLAFRPPFFQFFFFMLFVPPRFFPSFHQLFRLLEELDAGNCFGCLFVVRLCTSNLLRLCTLPVFVCARQPGRCSSMAPKKKVVVLRKPAACLDCSTFPLHPTPPQDPKGCAYPVDWTFLPHPTP